MNGLTLVGIDYSEFVEVDPTGRYGRYNEILGKGAVKTVYRAFDEYQGIEVAWNQVKLYDFLQSPEDLERLYCEIHLLKTLKHKNIMKFYTSWVDTANRNINFVTEMFTSGTLRQYRLKHKRVNIRAIKHWCRQILKGLLYLHSHDPPVIHRDLKCDNIFVNGNQGEVKIGDLGLAAILQKSHAVHCVGTPEFMAPEVYEEAYNELVDIYSFGMCILEMVTFEYPYSECTHPAQIYKKVISGKKPDALYTVKDPEVRQFIEKCLATVPLRLSARELLEDPFLQIDDFESDLRSVDYLEVDSLGPILREPYRHASTDSYNTGYCNGYGYVDQNDWSYHSTDVELNGIDLFEYHDDEQLVDVDISIKGKKRDDGSIFLRLRIMDKDGHVRNIYFPFDIENDRAFSVATEMVEELDLNDQDVTRIADMIDGEISSLVPEWRPGLELVETPHVANQSFNHNCVSNHTSNGSLMEFLKNNLGSKNFQLQVRHNRSASHGRFEEVTYQVDESENHAGEGTRVGSRWDHHESRELSTVDSDHFHTDEEYESLDQSACGKSNSDAKLEDKAAFQGRDDPAEPVSSPHSCSTNHSGDHEFYESEFQQEMRWLKAKHQLELREHKDHQFKSTSKSFVRDEEESSRQIPSSFSARPPARKGKDLRSDGGDRLYKGSPGSGTQRGAGSRAAIHDSTRAQAVTNAKKFQSGSLLPNLHRTTSLPVDAVHM